MESKLTYTSSLNKERKIEDIMNKATLHALGMLRDAAEMLDEEKFDGTKKLQITISVVDATK